MPLESLVAAAVDGVCLQTSESIGCAEELGLPAVVALNKVDLLPDKEVAQVSIAMMMVVLKHLMHIDLGQRTSTIGNVIRVREDAANFFLSQTRAISTPHVKRASSYRRARGLSYPSFTLCIPHIHISRTHGYIFRKLRSC